MLFFLCNNRESAFRLLADGRYRHDYITFMENVIEKGFAEKVKPGASSLSYTQQRNVWYIPHGNFNFSGENKIIFTMDITSLYNECLQAIKYFFNQRPIKKPRSETLLRLAELVLTLNCFSFGDNYYKQINSVAMGTKMGLS